MDILEIKKEYNSYLSKVKDASLVIASLLRSGEVSQALNIIQHFSEGVNWLIEVNSKMTQLGENVIFDIRSIEEFLIEINNGLEIEDYYLVADLFEYEISTFFKNSDRYIVTVI